MEGDRRTLLVTGGAGFIGSALCRHLVGSGRRRVVNVDKLTYAGSLDTLRSLPNDAHHSFHRADICDGAAMLDLLRCEQPGGIIHLAAESHVDRSIDGPADFLRTNVIGTFTLLEAALAYWRELPSERKSGFRFHHVSTDEVFGDLGDSGEGFTEATRYAPSSPYAASKASADHLVRVWHRTYGLPVILSSCSNNYGPFQHPEKLIPLTILNALEGRRLPVYGTGANVRDWLFVEDHAEALERIFSHGEVGETYLVGGRSERSNLVVVETLCDLLDARRPLADGASRRGLIEFVADRPGHDRRYAVDPTKVEQAFGWHPGTGFEAGLARTVDWYLDNEPWWRPSRGRDGASERLGMAR